MEAKVYIGIKLTWDYVHKPVTLYMPIYVHKALHIFQHILTVGKEYSPHTCAPHPVWKKDPICGPVDTAEYLSDKGDYVPINVTLSMPSYVHKALHIFQHILRGGKEYYPHTCAPIQYGKKIQYVDPLDTAEYLSDKETNLMQQVCGTFLYCAIDIDNTIIPALSNISLEKPKTTTNTAKQVAKILNYLA